MPFKYPDTLPEGAADLQALRDEAVKAFNEIYNAEGTPTPEEFEQLQYITNGLDNVDEALAAHADADDRAAEAASMAERMSAYTAEGNGDDAEDTEDAEAKDEDEAPAKRREDDKDATEDTEDTDGEADGEDEGGVQAAAKRTNFSHAARKQKRDLPEQTNGFRLTTSAQNFESGIVDTMRVATEFGHLAAGRAARVVGANGRSETTLAYVERNVPDQFSIGNEAEAITALDAATSEARLPGGSLVAAGGWVSPSETMYDFLPTLAASDLLSLPEVTVRRGGVKFPVEPDFSALYGEVGFHQTEAQAQAGEEKPCYEIPGADFEEVRLDVQGICLTAGILQDKAWPELTAKYVAEALRAHQHKISAWRISKLVEGSTNVGALTGPIFGAAGAVLSALELQVTDIRTKYRIPRTQSVEGVAPVWLLGVLRNDLAYRQGVLPEQVTDQQITAHFNQRGANIQFVVDWQTDGIGGATPATAWPSEVQVILYPSGTWWSAVEPVVNLGVIHDSTLLRQNKQVQLFTEDGVAVGKRGPESRLLTIPVSVDGTVGARYNAAGAVAGE